MSRRTDGHTNSIQNESPHYPIRVRAKKFLYPIFLPLSKLSELASLAHSVLFGLCPNKFMGGGGVCGRAEKGGAFCSVCVYLIAFIVAQLRFQTRKAGGQQYSDTSLCFSQIRPQTRIVTLCSYQRSIKGNVCFLVTSNCFQQLVFESFEFEFLMNQ